MPKRHQLSGNCRVGTLHLMLLSVLGLAVIFAKCRVSGRLTCRTCNVGE